MAQHCQQRRSLSPPAEPLGHVTGLSMNRHLWKWSALAAALIVSGPVPRGFPVLSHPNHPEGRMVFPKAEIQEIKKQEGRDLTRFDLDYDVPEHFLPEFQPPIYLTTRPDLGFSESECCLPMCKSILRVLRGPRLPYLPTQSHAFDPIRDPPQTPAASF